MVEIEQMIFIVFERLSHSVHVVHNEVNFMRPEYEWEPKVTNTD